MKNAEDYNPHRDLDYSGYHNTTAIHKLLSGHFLVKRHFTDDRNGAISCLHGSGV